MDFVKSFEENKDQEVARLYLSDEIGARKLRSRSYAPEISGWRALPAGALDIDLYRTFGFADAFSSLFVTNTGTDPLLIAFTVHAQIIWKRDVAAGKSAMFEFLSEPYPKCTFVFADVHLYFSHANYTDCQIRYLLWSTDIRNARARENATFQAALQPPRKFYYHWDGTMREATTPDGLRYEDYQGYALTVLKKTDIPHPRSRIYQWVLLPEPQPGKYVLPDDVQIYSSISVVNRTNEPISLRLLPFFRHTYILQPGPNQLELFWHEWWRPDNDVVWFLKGQPGLKIHLRVGNQRAPSFRYPLKPPAYNETARILVGPDDYVYHRDPKQMYFVDCYNRKELTKSMCLLALHPRVGEQSSFHEYLKVHPWSETNLLREIWHFL